MRDLESLQDLKSSMQDLKSSVQDLKSWPKKWNKRAMRRIAMWPASPRSPRWPLFGMLALGLVAGAAVGGFAVSKRAHMMRLLADSQRMSELAEMGTPEPMASYEVTVPRSNHRRKATSEV